MKAQLLAVPLLLALMLSPAFAAAATGTLTFTSPASGSSLSGVQAYIIAGTISPVPPAGTDNVNIQVTNPSAQVVDVQTVAVSNTGTFSYSTNAGGSAAWTSGTYHVLATDSNGATATITFTYTASSQQGSTGVALTATVNTNSLVYAGQTSTIAVLASWTNGSAAKYASVSGAVWSPAGAQAATINSQKVGSNGVVLISWAVPAGTADGLYTVEITATTASGYAALGQSGITVNSQVASTAALTALQTALTGSISSLGKNVSAIAASLASVASNVNSLGSSVSSVNSAVGSLSSTVGSINTNVNSLGTAVSGLTSSLNTVAGNVQSIQSAVNTLSSTVSTLSTSVSSISSSIQTLTSDVTGLQSTVNGLGNLSSQMTSLQNSVSSLNSTVSNEQTYILVVALIAAVTLVLELAILIRKMS